MEALEKINKIVLSKENLLDHIGTISKRKMTELKNAVENFPFNYQDSLVFKDDMIDILEWIVALRNKFEEVDASKAEYFEVTLKEMADDE